MSLDDPKVKPHLDTLTQIARAAAALIDGDEAGRIIVDRAYYYIANPDPRHRFLSGDYFDVDSDRFLRMKKFLLRLETLADFPCNAALWVRVRGLEDHVTVACQNGSIQRYYGFGEEKRRIEGEMAACLETGEITVAPFDEKDRTLTVLAPVRNSLGDTVGLVELSARNPLSESLTPAWS